MSDEMLQETIDLVSSLEAKSETQQTAKYELIEYTERLHKENEELKKQLEAGEEQYTDLVEEKEELKQLYDSLMQKVESQQKEFIEYLDNYIDALKQQKQTVSELDMAEVHILMTLEENLAKYKEIIGVKDE